MVNYIVKKQTQIIIIHMSATQLLVHQECVCIYVLNGIML